MIGAGIFAAETDAEAQRLFTSAQLQFLNMVRGRPGKLAATGREHGRSLERAGASGRPAADALFRGRLTGNGASAAWRK